MEWFRIHRDITGSTNEDAFVLGKNGARAWSVCTADKQTRGRGRLNREWYSPRGNGLYVSALIRPSVSVNEIGLLSFCAANAMTKAISTFGADVKIKWPNDLILNQKKICGILSSCDISSDGILNFAVIGAGVNIQKGSFPECLSESATSLEDEGFSIDNEQLLDYYVNALAIETGLLEENGFRGIRDYFLEHCITLGKSVQVSGSIFISGRAEEITDDGSLLVRDDEGNIHLVRSGDVSVRGLFGYV